MNALTLATETYKGNFVRRYYWDPNTRSVTMTSTKSTRWTSLTNLFMAVFLPHGYPESVSADYLQYQLWDSIQAFASSITGSISTHAVLKGAGVGDESASALAATMTFMLKDGTSMLGRILFSWMQGTKLDSDCKKWRLFADVLNDVSLFLDLITAYFRQHFLILVCISGLMKSIVGVAGGATRAALTQHQARKNNMADVSAKDGSQETLVNLSALICSLIFIPVVVHSNTLIWTLYCVMTVIHIMANYYAVKSVSMEVFNIERFNIYMSHYLKSSMRSYLAVEEVNKRENVFPLLKSGTEFKLGVSLSDALGKQNFSTMEELTLLYKSCGYLLSISKAFTGQKGKISICFRGKVNAKTQLEAMYHACLLSAMLSAPLNECNENYLWKIYDKEHENQQRHETEMSLLSFTRKLTTETFQNFMYNTARIGWRTDITLFNVDLWHVSW